MFKNHYVLMDQAGDGSGGGGGSAPAGGNAGGSAPAGGNGGGSAPAGDDFSSLKPEEIKARFEALLAEKTKLAENNKALLNEKINAQKAIEEKAREASEKARKEAEASGDAKALLAIAQKELETTRAEIEAMKNEVKSKLDQEESDAKINAFKEDMKDYKFHDFEAVKNLVDWSKYVVEKKDGKLTINPDGRKQAKAEFLKKYSWAIVPSDAEAERSQPKPKRGNDQADMKDAWAQVFKK